ncbi:MAG: sigma-54-dependent Fis family transcriptional regulator [Vicinamibacteria bacterium]|nr:sigma-54-dependent Fis family transcriptional regulator [Vicinamibacteria bacterium]
MPDTPKHLLLVEDEAPLRTAVAERLADHGYEVVQADSGEAALEALAEFAFDIVVTDLRLPGIDGTSVIEAAVERYPEIIGIVMTGYGTVRDAVEVIKRGAADFVTKPFQFDELRLALDGAIEQRRLKSENAWLREQLQQRYSFEGIVGRSRVMRDLFQTLETVARTASTILVSGETGTGKEVVARAIHHASPRRGQRFVALNCSAIPENLLEAEIFGHVRGAFTGAIGTRQGRLEQAHRGTLFLDEVGTMSMPLQVKLLRVLQEREFERVGDNQTIKVDVRVIAATNADLGRMVADGSFREDLYYRLNVIPVTLPPLRDRREDIPLLVQHFLQKFCNEVGRPVMTVSQAAMRSLMTNAWPGNVRQLENAMERAVALSGSRTQIEIGDLPPDIQQASDAGDWIPGLALPDDGLDFDAFISRVEHEVIRRALERTGGNKAAAASVLNLKRTTLVEKLKRLEGLA